MRAQGAWYPFEKLNKRANSRRQTDSTPPSAALRFFIIAPHHLGATPRDQELIAIVVGELPATGCYACSTQIGAYGSRPAHTRSFATGPQAGTSGARSVEFTSDPLVHLLAVEQIEVVHAVADPPARFEK